ncbi:MULTISPECIES: restriction endonuclease subunit S [Shewanella]|uniref:Type I restriction modification DNA specificity domain-containing protein n=1 Tax=Shewanella marisflavi TaxID=260364 RepID=A0ABX5WP29_9GAMM|nr:MULTISPECIES: restriction endonuclease subunit S [Shewanella]QDF76229.1 hypothetical protein FGA12_14335 [Shewanella marisflavi]
MSNTIPEGWVQNKLGKYVGIQGGNAFKSEAFTEVGIPVVRISNIKKDGSINLNSSIFANEDASLSRFKVQYGDILIAMSGATTGKVGRYTLNNYSYLNQRVGRFFAKGSNDVSMDYIHQVTAKDSFVQSILIDAIGGAQPNISNQQIESIIALFPPLPEQQKIAAILTSVDEVIEKTQAKIDKLKDLKTAMMQELLTKGIGTKQGAGDGEGYIPHTEFKDSPVGRIPKSWEVVKLESVAVIQTGAAKSSKLTGDLVELPYLRVANVQDGFLDLSEIKNIMIPRSKSSRFLLKENDVLVNEGGDFDKLGRGSIWSGQITPCAHQNHVFVVRTNVDKLSPKFFNHLSGSEHGKKYYMGCAKQTTNLASINSTQLKQFPVLLPSMEEQNQICGVLDSIDENIQNHQAKLVKRKVLKKALMQDLLTGKVRVKLD